MATPPTLAQEDETVWTLLAQGGTRVSGSLSITASCVIVVAAATGDQSVPWASIANSGAALTWTQAQVLNVASNTWMSLWTAIGDSTRSMTVTLTASGSGGSRFCGFDTTVWTGSDGVGASNKAQTTGGPSVAVTTLAANSAMYYLSSDWNAVDGTTRTHRTVNSITPTAGNGLELVYFRDSSQYTNYGAYINDCGATGAKTVGVSAPVGQKFGIVAVEIKGTAGGGGGTVVKQLSALGVG